MTDDVDKKKKPLSAEEIAKIFNLIAKAYKQAGKNVKYATVYSGDEDVDGTILVPTQADGDVKLEFEDIEGDKNKPDFTD